MKTISSPLFMALAIITMARCNVIDRVDPKMSADTTTTIKQDTTDKDKPKPTPIVGDYGNVPLFDIHTRVVWKNIPPVPQTAYRMTEPGQLIIIRSAAELANYTDQALPEVDFDKYAILLYAGWAPYNIEFITKSLTRNDADRCTYKINVHIGMLTVAPQWQLAVMAPKSSLGLSVDTKVEFLPAGLMTEYYWSSGERIPVSRYPKKWYVVFKAADAQEVKMRLMLSSSVTTITDPLECDFSYIAECRPGSEIFKDCQGFIVDYWGMGDMYAFSDKIIYAGPSFRYDMSRPAFPLAHFFNVKLKNAADEPLLQALADKYKVVMIGKWLSDGTPSANGPFALYYFLGCTRASAGNPLEIANAFYETGLFAEAFPEIFGGIELFYAPKK